MQKERRDVVIGLLIMQPEAPGYKHLSLWHSSAHNIFQFYHKEI